MLSIYLLIKYIVFNNDSNEKNYFQKLCCYVNYSVKRLQFQFPTHKYLKLRYI